MKIDNQLKEVSKKQSKKSLKKRSKKRSEKQVKKREKKKGRWIKRFFWFLTFNFFIICVVALAGMVFIRQRLKTLPVVDIQYLSTYEPSVITDKDGNIIWKPTDKRMTSLAYEEIPEFYKTAVIEIEDKDFFTNHGVSVKGVANMVYGVLKNKFIDESYKPRGGSTIEQQLIKNKFYGGGQDYEVTTRKIQELFLAVQMDQNFTKEEIFTFYVNGLEYAEGSTGLGTIMKTYFGKSPEDYKERTPETIAELSYLAGLSQAPTTYNLYDNPENAEKRKKDVLNILLTDGYISGKEYVEASEFLLTTNLQPRGWEANEQIEQNKKYKFYTDGVMEELSHLGYNINDVSLTVKTFLDPEKFDAVTDLVHDPEYYLDDDQQTGVAVVDKDGVVVCLVGSSKADDGEFNRAVSKSRSSGSSMKPFTAYGPLLQYFGDKYDTSSTFDTSPYKYPGTNVYMNNYGGGVYGNQTMQKCLRYSYNTPVGRIDDDILGSVRMKTFLHGVGLDEKDTYSSVDGIGLNISPLQSAAAYNAINSGGIYTRPRFIDTLTFSDGSVKVVEPEQTVAMNPSVAYVLTQILRGVPGGDGTAGRAAIPEYEGYAGKTGSVKFDSSVKAPKTYGDGGSDVWYCSITNQGYAVSVWCGYDIPNTSPRIPSYYFGQQFINRDIQKLLNGDKEIPNWEMPDGVKKISGSGLSAHYKVTDSFDLGDTGINWVNLTTDNAVIKQIIPDDAIPDNWDQTEDDNWYDYYLQYGDQVPDVIDKELYERIKGQ